MAKIRQRKSNKGFTLTEVIIAVSILAIAATPLISNFVKSGTMNKNAREHLNATNIAQDIMEGLSAYKGEQVINMFESTDSLNGKILPSATQMRYGAHGDLDDTGMNPVYEVQPGSASVTGTPRYSDHYEDGKSTKVKMDKTKPEYLFFIDDLKQNKTTYDVRIKMSYANYMNSFGVDMNRLYDVKSKVDCIYSNIEDMAAPTDNAYTKAKAKFVSKSTTSLTDSMLDGKIEHHIECEVSNIAPAGSDPNYSVALNDYYSVRSADRTSLGLTSDYAYNVVTAEPIYSNGNIEAPRNIYIYYTGTQGSTMGNRLDYIDLINNTDQPVCFYVIRQKRTTGDSLNTNYGCTLNISSPNDDLTADPKLYLTSVVQNLRYDLNYDAIDNLKYYKEGTANAVVDAPQLAVLNTKRGLPADHTPEASDTHYDKTRCEIYYNSVTDLISQEDYVECVFDGMKSDVTPSIYDVTVEVYDTKSNKKVATYTGSLSGGTM